MRGAFERVTHKAGDGQERLCSSSTNVVTLEIVETCGAGATGKMAWAQPTKSEAQVAVQALQSP